MRQVITIALTEEEYKRWQAISAEFSQKDLFVEGLKLAEEYILIKKGGEKNV